MNDPRHNHNTNWHFLSREEIRTRCLEVASRVFRAHSTDEILEQAEKMYNWVQYPESSK